MVGLGVRAAFAAAAVVAGCASSSESPPDPTSNPDLPDGSKLLVDLTDAEALALCEWESDRLHYGNCLDDAILLSRSMSCTSSLAACTAPEAIASQLIECARNTVDRERYCDTTVAERLRCDLDLQRQYDALPPCDRVTDEVVREVLYSTFPPSCATLGCP
jgi:hypothetical protein